MKIIVGNRTTTRETSKEGLGLLSCGVKIVLVVYSVLCCLAVKRQMIPAPTSSASRQRLPDTRQTEGITHASGSGHDFFTNLVSFGAKTTEIVLQMPEI
jgi:hypothetical protein